MKNNLLKKPPTTWSTETSLTASTTESRPSRKCSQSVSVASAQSIAGVKKRAIHVNDNTLCPGTGALCHRLSVHSGAHMTHYLTARHQSVLCITGVGGE